MGKSDLQNNDLPTNGDSAREQRSDYYAGKHGCT
jgi:hypothetical protein